MSKRRLSRPHASLAHAMVGGWVPSDGVVLRWAYRAGVFFNTHPTPQPAVEGGRFCCNTCQQPTAPTPGHRCVPRSTTTPATPARKRCFSPATTHAHPHNTATRAAAAWAAYHTPARRMHSAPKTRAGAAPQTGPIPTSTASHPALDALPILRQAHYPPYYQPSQRMRGWAWRAPPMRASQYGTLPHLPSCQAPAQQACAHPTAGGLQRDMSATCMPYSATLRRRRPKPLPYCRSYTRARHAAR